MRLSVNDILDIQWSTTQSLKLGDNEFSPALVLHIAASPTAATTPKLMRAAANGGAFSTPPVSAAARALALASGRAHGSGSLPGTSHLPVFYNVATLHSVRCQCAAEERHVHKGMPYRFQMHHNPSMQLRSPASLCGLQAAPGRLPPQRRSCSRALPPGLRCSALTPKKMAAAPAPQRSGRR